MKIAFVGQCMKTPGLFQNNPFNYKSVVQYGSKSRNWLLNLFPSKICLVRHVPKAQLDTQFRHLSIFRCHCILPPAFFYKHLFFVYEIFNKHTFIRERRWGKIPEKEAHHQKGCVSALKRCQLRKMRLHKNKDSSFLCFSPISTNIFAIVSVFSRDFLFASVEFWRKWCNCMFSLLKVNIRSVWKFQQETQILL